MRTGWLTKKPQHPQLLSHDRVRFFRLTSDSLEWFKPDQDTHRAPHGRLLLEGLRIVSGPVWDEARIVLQPAEGPQLVLYGDDLEAWHAAILASLKGEGGAAPATVASSPEPEAARGNDEVVSLRRQLAEARAATLAAKKQVESEAKAHAAQLAKASAQRPSDAQRQPTPRAHATKLLSAVDQLVDQARKAQADSKRKLDAHARHSKFAESAPFTLAFGDMPVFFDGLENLVGQPSPILRVAMEAEHCSSADSDDDLTTGNYGITTKPIIEWHAVVDPVGGLVHLKLEAYPAETKNIEEDRKRGPGLKPLAEFEAVLEVKNKVLVAKGGEKSRVLLEEFIAGRLYTGPMFEKYNLICRSSIKQAPQFMKDQCNTKCKGNSYPTTINLLNSLIIKLSKLTKASTVYRGVSQGVLPKCFWEDNEEGVRGGIEAGFMSTTTNREVAISYAGGLQGATPMLFEMQQGMIDRGAVIDFLSQYPHEKEVLFAPLTCIELSGAQNEENAIILHMKLTINLLAPTIEKVITKLKASHVDLLHLFELNFKTNAVPADQLVPLRRLITEVEAKEGASFNDAEIFQAATAKAFEERGAVLRWMVEGARLVEPWPKVLAKIGTRLDPYAVPTLQALAEEERLRVGAEVAATKDNDIFWKFGCTVTAVDGDAITVKTRAGKELAGLPPSRVLIVREGGTGALLREAAAAGKDKMVEALLSAGASPFVVADTRLNTALHLAAAAGHTRICRMLCAKGADDDVHNAQRQDARGLARANKHGAVLRVFFPTLSDKEFTEEACAATPRLRAAAEGDVAALAATAAGEDEGTMTALMVATRAQQLAAVEALLRTASAATLDAQSATGCTALYLAAEEGDERIVAKLLARGASVALVDAYGNSALTQACVMGHAPCAKLLLEAGADAKVEDMGFTLLMFASQQGHAEVAKLLLANGADVDKAPSHGMTALMQACQNGHADVAKLLLASGADVHKATQRVPKGHTALILASKNGHAEVTKLLLANGADVHKADSKGVTALQFACTFGHAEVAKLLLANGADVQKAGSNGATALMMAAQNGHSEAVKLLLANGADLQKAAPGGQTALLLMCQNGHAEVAKLLLANGADVDKAHSHGITALMQACENGHSEVAKLLLASGADVQKANAGGFTALMQACENGHSEVAKLLLASGADVHKADSNGVTALMQACAGGHADIVHLLLSNGADVHTAMPSGRTALAFAKDDAIKQLLRQAGARG